MALPTPPPYSDPIPNNPFYSPETYVVQGAYSPLVVGSGLSVSPSGVISSSGGGGGGGVSQIIGGSGILVTPGTGTGIVTVVNSGVTALNAGTGINLSATTGSVTINSTALGTVTSIIPGTGLAGSSNPITTSGTICLATIPGVAGSYTNASFTVDPTGRVTSATSGTAVLSIGATLPLSVTAGVNPVVSIADATTLVKGAVLLSDSTTSNSSSEAATSLAVKTAYDAAIAAIPKSCITAQGTLITGTAASTPVALPLGTDGFVLTADSACVEGIKWAASGGGGASPATPTVEGIVYGCTDAVNFNYGLGDGILSALTTGTLNIAVGAGALASTDSGTSNTAVGIGALYSNTSGIQNVALGQQALFANTTEGLNTAIGSQALQSATGGANTAVGNFAGNLVTTGCSNILIGNQAGGSGAGALDTGNNNVVIGNCVSVANNAGDCQLAIGVNTVCWLTGTSAGAIKPGAGIIDCAGSCGTAGQVLSSTGANSIEWVAAGGGGGSPATPTVAGLVLGCTVVSNTGLGCNSLLALTTGLFNVAAGPNALCSLTTGNSNIAIGNNTLICNVSNTGNVAVGNLALCCNTANSNTAIGTGALRLNTTGTFNTAVGSNAMICNQTGSCNVAVGSLAQNQVCNGSRNVAVGYCTMPGLPGGTSVGSDNVVVGLNNMLNFTTACQNVAIGNCALGTPRTGNGNVAVGYQAGQAAFGDDNVAIGRNALVGPIGVPPATGPIRNVAIGVDAGRCVTTGECNVLIGPGAGCGCTIESRCLVIAFSPTEPWLTGNGTQAIKPGAGIIDCAASCGTANQVLVSTGANAIQWKTLNSALAVPNYGSFYDTTSQLNTVGTGTGRAITLNTVDAATNFSISGGSCIVAACAGTYNLQFSAQFETTTASLQTIEIWLVQNGTPVPNSNTEFTTKGAGESYFAALNYIVTLAAGGNVQLYWASGDSNMVLKTHASSYGGPQIPSMIATIVPVGA